MACCFMENVTSLGTHCHVHDDLPRSRCDLVGEHSIRANAAGKKPQTVQGARWDNSRHRFFAGYLQASSATGGIKLIARSASAVMVRLGFTPRLAPTTDPSQMYIFL